MLSITGCAYTMFFSDETDRWDKKSAAYQARFGDNKREHVKNLVANQIELHKEARAESAKQNGQQEPKEKKEDDVDLLKKYNIGASSLNMLYMLETGEKQEKEKREKKEKM